MLVCIKVVTLYTVRPDLLIEQCDFPSQSDVV